MDDNKSQKSNVYPFKMEIEQLLLQRNDLVNYFSKNNLIDFFPLGFIVINKTRQIVFHNKNVNLLLGVDPSIDLIGKTPGEAFNCDYSDYDLLGCGASDFCSQCNASHSILSAFSHIHSREECNILTKTSKALNLVINTEDLIINNETYVMAAIQDNSSAKYREMLEKIFFHDILNTLNSLKGVTDIVREYPYEINEFKNTLSSLTGSLIEQIKSQKQLLEAENDTLATRKNELNSYYLITTIIDNNETFADSLGVKLKIDNDMQKINFISDTNLTFRILGNMIKNAIEASNDGNIVTVNCFETENSVDFTVHNETIIPKNVQLQIFQRAFSTKGTGRGLGTYSMKLLMERYLKGKISFVSNDEVGTIFTASFPKENEHNLN